MRPTTLDDSNRHDAQCWNPLPYYRPPALAPALPPAVSHTPDEACCQLLLRSILQLHHPSPSTLGFPHAHHAIPAQKGPIQPQRANLRPGPVCRSGLWSIGLSPILCCAVLPHPLHRLAVFPSPSLCPPGTSAGARSRYRAGARLGTEGSTYDETRPPPYPPTRAPHGIAPHRTASASGRPQWPARRSRTSCTPTLPCPISSTRNPHLNAMSHTAAQRILCPPHHLGTTHIQPLPVSRPQHLALPTRRPSPPLPPLPVLLQPRVGAPLPVPLPTRRPAAMPPTPAFTSVPTA